jgi:non-ribosomal peptide synthetase component F
MVPHSAVRHLVTDIRYFPLWPEDSVASLSNPAFDATTFEIWSTLTSGATLTVLPPVSEIDIDDWAGTLRDCGVSVMFVTSALLEIITREYPDAFASLRGLLFGGEAVSINTVRRILAAGPPATLLQMYGPTETTTFATAFRCTPESLAGRERVPLGLPLQHMVLRVLDAEKRPTPENAVGELWISGPGVAHGYLGRADLTAQRFVRLPGDPSGRLSYRSGDLVRTLPDGTLEFVGRLDRQVKLRGFRIELDEIEQAVLATGLAHAVTVDKVGNGAAAHLVAVVQPAGPAADADHDDRSRMLADALATRLPGYMLPARWVAVDRMPVTSTGKIDRARLLADMTH